MKKEAMIKPALRSTACILRVSKLVALRRLITSSMRGWSQPEVVLGVECAAALGVRGEGVGGGGAWRRGVRLRMGSESVVASAVDDMVVCCSVSKSTCRGVDVVSVATKLFGEIEMDAVEVKVATPDFD